MTPERIAELRALADAAAPGPWSTSSDPVRDGYRVFDATDTDIADTETYHGSRVATFGEPDAAFIAAARTALPDALDAIARVRAIGTITPGNAYREGFNKAMAAVLAALRGSVTP